MKKTFGILFMLLLGGALYAGPVTPEKALRVAQSVFASEPGTKAAGESNLQIVWDGEFEPATKGALDPALYVITRPEGGFVMVAGSDNVQPVLAFSFENEFIVEGMPVHVRSWMEQYKRYVRSAGAPTVEIQEQWALFEETKDVAIPITEGFSNPFTASHTNEWNQTNPANFLCPDVDPDNQTETSVCGCTALALAEVMAWFGPQNRSLTSYVIPGYSYKSDKEETEITIPSHDLYTSYSTDTWTALKNLTTANSFYGTIEGVSSTNFHDYLYYGKNRVRPKIGGKNTLTATGEALAHLVYDIGTVLNSVYNEGVSSAFHFGTGANPGYIVNNVAPVFKYSNTARLAAKDNYTRSQWQKMLKDEITLRPVIYTGYTESAGHAYVADGYATYNDGITFHFNMGWGGAYNGYYTLEIQDEYDRNHYAILDFYPSESFALAPYIEYSSEGGFTDVSGYNTGNITFTMNYFWNWQAAFHGVISVGLESSSGELRDVEELSDVDLEIGWGYNAWQGIKIIFPEAVFGDRLVAYYKESDKSTYFPFRYNPRTVGMTAVPFFPAAAIDKQSSYVTGDLFVFKLTNHIYDYSLSTWTVTTPSGVTTPYTMDSDSVLLSEAGDYKITCTTPDQETLVTYITVTAP